MPGFCQLWLTCKDRVEAGKIVKVLLDKKLIACVRQLPVTSDYIWKNKIESGNEVLLLMESREDLFNAIEMQIAKIHSYDTFMLQMVPITKTSKDAQQWLDDSLNK